MAASKPELRSRGKGKTETKDVKTPDAKKKTAEPAGPMDAQGNVMNADYYFKQYVGLVLSMVAFGCVCFAGYAPKYGYTVNLFLYSSTSHPSVPCPFSLLGASHRDALRSPSIPNSKESFRRLPSYTFLTAPPSILSLFLYRRRVRVRRLGLPRVSSVQERGYVRDGQSNGGVLARAGSGGEDSGGRRGQGGEEKGVKRFLIE